MFCSGNLKLILPCHYLSFLDSNSAVSKKTHCGRLPPFFRIMDKHISLQNRGTKENFPDYVESVNHGLRAGTAASQKPL